MHESRVDISVAGRTGIHLMAGSRGTASVVSANAIAAQADAGNFLPGEPANVWSDLALPVLRRTFSFYTILVAVLIAGIHVFCLNRNILSDPDIWWHLRNARYLISTHTFLRQDLYTSTIYGKPWLNPEWLAELPYYAAWRLAGFRGIYLLTVGMIEVLALGVCALSWQRVHNIKAAILAPCVFIFMASVSTAPRTQLFGWCCLIAELFVLEKYRRGKNHLWLLPIVFAVWINLHGSWPIGILFLAIYTCCGLKGFEWGSLGTTAWTASQRTRLLSVFALSVTALFVNPYGWRLVVYPFRIAFAHKLTISTVVEWQTLDFHSFRGKFVFTTLAALMLFGMARKRKWDLVDLLPLLIATLAAFTYSRFLLLEAIVLPPLLARELTLFSPYKPELDRPWLNFGVVVMMAIFIGTHVPSELTLQQQADDGYPARAVEYLQTHPLPGRLLNDFNWGGYLIWNLPQTPVFIDTRADAFEERGIYAEYLDAILVKRPLEILDKYRIQSVLMPKADPLSYLLMHSSGWIVRYQDETAVIMQRSAPLSAVNVHSAD